MFKKALLLAAFGSLSMASFAEPLTYIIDSAHTYPAFEADHQGGLSLWRGKINSTTGVVIFDKEAETGTVSVEMDMNTIDFGFDAMNFSATDHIIFAADFPTASYTGELVDFVDGAPTKVDGTLTLMGVSRDLDLDINQFLCKPHFRHGREICGADASTSFNRGDFGVDYGLDTGFLPEVTLNISIEAGIPES